MSIPKIWARFTKTNNNVETKFRIQEVSSEKYEEVLDMFMKYHTPEEPIRVVAGVSNNKTAAEEFRRVMLEIMFHEKQLILVCCVDDDNEWKLVGASKMTLIERNAEKVKHDYNIKTKELKDFFKLRESLYDAYNVLKEHDVDSYFADRGLVVDPEFRGMGIAEELLKARYKACKAHNTTLYTGIATAVPSQIIAEKLGAKTVRELNLEEYAKRAGISYSGPQIIFKFMIWARFTKTFSNVETKFRIQEVSSEKYEEVLDLFMKYHTPEEPIRVVAGVSNNKTAAEEFRRVMLEIMFHEKQQVLVCCVDDGKEWKLVGASKMTLIERNAVKVKRDYNIKTKELKDFFKLRESLYDAYNVLKEHDVDSYFADRGLVVDPDFRGMGIAEELLKARFKVCKANDITLYTGLATAIVSQIIGEKLGAITVRKLNLEEYAQRAGISYFGPQVIVKLMVSQLASIKQD